MLSTCEWTSVPHTSHGILCGCDQTQEWLLTWWWERYTAENTFPVCFIDFGMSEKARQWCKERGRVIDGKIEANFIAQREKIAPDLVEKWEGFYGKTLWAARQIWFQKPFSLLHSPFEISLWVDLDCEILGSLQPLFSVAKSYDIGLVREVVTDDLRYNGGVILFAHGAKIIQKWARASLDRTHCFWSDDALLSALLLEEQSEVLELPEIYNWRLVQGVNPSAIIHHWVGSAGKAYIQAYGGIKKLIDCLPGCDAQ